MAKFLRASKNWYTPVACRFYNALQIMAQGTGKTKQETNPTAHKKLLRHRLSCPICPPNRGENSSRKPKHGKTKPKYKSHRK